GQRQVDREAAAVPGPGAALAVTIATALGGAVLTRQLTAGAGEGGADEQVIQAEAGDNVSLGPTVTACHRRPERLQRLPGVHSGRSGAAQELDAHRSGQLGRAFGVL